jgi:hypothetical protein
MSPVIATRRRAAEFDAVVEGTSAHGAHGGRYDDLIELVGALRAVPEPEPRPDFVTELRARLVASAEAMPARDAASDRADRLRLRSPDPGRVRNPKERRAAIAVGTLALVGATTTLSVVAQGALPGDVLYPLKRGIENAHAGISIGDDNKGDALLSNASTRLDEVADLARAGGDENADAISDTLDDFTQQATEASDHLLAAYADNGDQSAITDLRSFTATSMRELADLDGKLPASAEDEWELAVTTLVSIDDEARLACPACAGTDLDGITPDLTTGTDTSPAGTLSGFAHLPGLTLPSLDASGLPPGSVDQPGPAGGPAAPPTLLPTSLPTLLPSNGPSGQPTKLPTALPTSGLPSGLPTKLPSQLPTALPTSALPSGLPTVGLTTILDPLTGGPTPVVPVPSVDVTGLLGGLGSALPSAVTSPLD